MPKGTAIRFFVIFSIILFLTVAGNFFFLSDSTNSLSPGAITLISFTTATLTQSNFNLNSDPSIEYILFVILITQFVGLLFNGTLFWLCRQIFGSSSEKKLSVRDAFAKALWISLIIQALLFVFFIYSVPVSDLNTGNKLISSLVLATGSFELAGIPFLESMFSNGFLERNYVVQLGIIGGVTLGNLGFYVIYELFSLQRLRQRYEDPTKDWSFITKLCVFAGGIGIILLSLVYWTQEKERLLLDKNITESAIASIYEITSARGFGVSLFTESNTMNILKTVVATLLTGPFSNSGGLTLLVFGGFALFFKIKRKSFEFTQANRLLLFIVLYTAVGILIAWSISFLGSINWTQIVPAFTGNSVTIPLDIKWNSSISISLILLFGKLVFVSAAFWYAKKTNQIPVRINLSL